MLCKLSIKNFAIIEDIDISFHDGLTVLTGETGAGKSLIIDSIDLLLGERANLEMIRNGEDKASITGTFTINNTRLMSLLMSLDISYDDKLVIARTISSNKSVIKANDKTISLGELKQIARFLADIHQQFDMVKLLNKDNYLDIVDGMKYELINEYKAKYLSSLEILKEKHRAYVSLLNKINEIKAKKDEYQYIYDELDRSNLSLNEEEEINSRIEFLKHYEEIYSLLGDSKSLIERDSLNDIYQIKENVSKLNKYQSEYEDMNNRLNDYYYELEAIYEDLIKKFNRLDYSPEELDELENRRSELEILKKKYKKNIEELIAYKDELSLILQSDENLDASLKESKQALLEAYEKTYKDALDLSNIRKEVAKGIEKELVTTLSDLMLKVDFKIDFVTALKDKECSLDIFKDNGIDEIDFLIETNIGEGLKPLAKIVSGGEMSRIMFAFKSILIKAHKISTVIFDEADTGISGEVAQKFALMVKKISLNTQVIAITHLPQLASLSNNHIKISKNIVKGRTFTTIKELSLDEKIYEIASLISGGKVTEKQLEYAKEMVLSKEDI